MEEKKRGKERVGQTTFSPSLVQLISNSSVLISKSTPEVHFRRMTSKFVENRKWKSKVLTYENLIFLFLYFLFYFKIKYKQKQWFRLYLGVQLKELQSHSLKEHQSHTYLSLRQERKKSETTVRTVLKFSVFQLFTNLIEDLVLGKLTSSMVCNLGKYSIFQILAGCSSRIHQFADGNPPKDNAQMRQCSKLIGDWMD